jgi:hypothetical protein
MILAYVAACVLVTVLAIAATWAKPEHLGTALASAAGWCGGLATGIGLGMWGNAQEHKAKGGQP